MDRRVGIETLDDVAELVTQLTGLSWLALNRMPTVFNRPGTHTRIAVESFGIRSGEFGGAFVAPRGTFGDAVDFLHRAIQVETGVRQVGAFSVLIDGTFSDLYSLARVNSQYVPFERLAHPLPGTSCLSGASLPTAQKFSRALQVN